MQCWVLQTQISTDTAYNLYQPKLKVGVILLFCLLCRGYFGVTKGLTPQFGLSRGAPRVWKSTIQREQAHWKPGV